MSGYFVKFFACCASVFAKLFWKLRNTEHQAAKHLTNWLTFVLRITLKGLPFREMFHLLRIPVFTKQANQDV